MNKIVIDRYRVGDIPVLTVYSEGAEKCPLIFYAHGLGGDKDARLDLGCLLAKEGFYFVAFDAQMHGERMSEKIMAMLKGEGLTYPAPTQIDFLYLVMKTVKQNAQDIDTLIEYFADDSATDLDRIGVIGTSMGGCTAFYVAANNPRIKVAIPMLASPYFTKTWEDHLLENYAKEKWTKELDAVTDETKTITEFIRSIDPGEKIKEFAPKPLYILGGEKDSTVPKSYLIEAYGELRPLYADNPDRLCLSICKGIEHSSNIQMFFAASKWFKKFL